MPGALAGRLRLAGTMSRNTYTWLLQYGQKESGFFMVTEGSKSKCFKRQDVKLNLFRPGLSNCIVKLTPNSIGQGYHRAHPGSRFKGEEVPQSR